MDVTAVGSVDVFRHDHGDHICHVCVVCDVCSIVVVMCCPFVGMVWYYTSIIFYQATDDTDTY